ncbi:MAG: hypothetical protein IK100_11890 [Muribaculaceae bacterium]|nr:hypothetical protein [Muribaculaceae bacterium]
MRYYINSKGEKINGSEYNTEHPDGKILLMDGSELTCYEKQDASNDKIDEDEKKRLFKLFTDNAFYLLAHRDRILSDSRMFLCPKAVKSGMMYSGHSGFNHPTLGIYLEWWRDYPYAMITDKDGTRSLIYYLSGNPLSGANWSKSVDENGDSHEAGRFYSFMSQMRPFIGVNNRYAAAKQRYQAYSLEEVLDILHNEDDDNDNTSFSHTITVEFMQSSIIRLNRKIEALNKLNKELNDQYEDLFYKVYSEDLRRIYAKYKDVEQRFNSEIQREKEAIRPLKAMLRQGTITLKEYESKRHDITHRIKDLGQKLFNVKHDCLHELSDIMSASFYGIEQIEHYIDKYNNNGNE